MGLAVRIVNRIFRFARGIFQLAFNLLCHAFHLERRIASPFAGLSPGASHHFVDRALHSICVHRSTSMGKFLEI
jgi:hypothetical protein